MRDFFEFLGSAATVVAVVLAIISLNRWKIEVGAASDHELARKMAVIIQRYRIELVDLWQFADSASRQNESEHWMHEQNDYSKNIYEYALSRMRAARADLEAISLESSAIWGNIFDTTISEAFQFENVCANTISNYLYLCKTRPIEISSWEFSEKSINMWREFNHARNLSDDTVEDKINLILKSVRFEIEKKLLRENS